MYLSDLLAALRRHWLVAVAALAIWALIGVAMATLPTERYRATTTLAVQPGPETDDIIQTATYQIPIIVKSIQSSDFYKQVQAVVNEEFESAAVSIAATAPVGTGLIDISVTGADPAAVAAWANAASGVLSGEPDPSGLVLDPIQSASEPSEPYSPRVTPIAVGTLGLGLLSGLVAAVVVARVGRALDVAEEIQRRSGVAVLGRLPNLSELRSDKSGQGSASALRRSSEVVEAFRTVTTNIELALSDDVAPAIAVISGSTGEGRSTVTAGVAVTMAMAGNAVLAIDADLRRPALHTQLGQPFSGEGMSRISEGDVGAVVQRTEVPNLWLLPAGVPDRHPADLLGTSLPLAIAYGREHNQRILIDCPPLDGVAETAMIAAIAGLVVVVVDPRRTDLAELEALIARIRSGGVRVVGVVLNRVGRNRRRRPVDFVQPVPAMARQARPVSRSRRPPRSPS